MYYRVLLLFSVCTSHCVIHWVDTVSLQNVPIYLAQEAHYPKPAINTAQYNDFTQALRERKTTERDLYILVEKPGSVLRLGPDRMIMRDIHCFVEKECKDKNIYVENSEIRCAAGAFIALMVNDNYPNLPYSSREKSCNAREVTLQDVLSEFAEYSQLLEDKKAMQSVAIQKIFNEHLNKAHQACKEFVRVFDSPELLQKNGCQVKGAFTPASRRWVCDTVMAMFDPLFELCILDRIIALNKDGKEVFLICGSDHTQQIRQMLGQDQTLVVKKSSLITDTSHQLTMVFSPYNWHALLYKTACAVTVVGVAVLCARLCPYLKNEQQIVA